jgi:hypothetical protein
MISTHARRIYPTRVVDNTIGEHSPGMFEALSNRFGVSVFEVFDDHEQHASECTRIL